MRTILITIIVFGLISCVQKQHIKNVTFKVDVTGIENIQTIGVKGNFTNPSWKVEIPLRDTDKDGVFETTLIKETAINNIEFKFVKNGKVYELKDKPNRILQFEYKPETIIYKVKFDDPENSVTRN